MPVYHKTESGWKLVLLMWEKRAPGWSMVNPLYVKKSETIWEALPFGTMLAPAITGPANGYAFKAGSAVVVNVSAISSSGFADAGAGTQIQIATDAGFANIVSAYDGAYATSWTSAALYTAGTYYVRARHRGANLGWGPWSAATWFSVAAAVGTVGFSASTTWTVPYDGTYTIFVCGGGGGGGCGGGNVGAYGGGAGGDTQVYTISGTSVNLLAGGGGGGGGGGGATMSNTESPGLTGAASSWYTGGTGGARWGNGSVGNGGTGSSPYGMGGSGGGGNNKGGVGGAGGNGGTNSQSVWLAQGSVLQIVVGSGGAGGNGNPYGYQSGLSGNPGSAGVVYITG